MAAVFWQRLASCRTKGELAVVAVIDRARFVFRLADHCREHAQAHAVQSAEVDPFGRFSVEPGPGRHQLMKVGIGVSAVALGSLHRLSVEPCATA